MRQCNILHSISGGGGRRSPGYCCQLMLTRYQELNGFRSRNIEICLSRCTYQQVVDVYGETTSNVVEVISSTPLIKRGTVYVFPVKVSEAMFVRKFQFVFRVFNFVYGTICNSVTEVYR